MIAQLRSPEPQDLDALHAITMHPGVAPWQQTKPGKRDYQELQMLLNGIPTDPIWNTELHVIHSDNLILGYICTHHTQLGVDPLGAAGWNLHPDYWGRGIMSSVLPQRRS